MLKSTRHSQIKQLVESNGHVTVQELNERLKVSEATVRRDLEQLAQMGWVRRTHGGAVKVERATKEPAILHRQTEYEEQKRRIGEAAATLVQPGHTIFMGSGSTVAAIVPHIGDIDGLTVISNSLPVVNQVAGMTNIELIVIGGMFRQSELSMVGHIAEAAIREFRADMVFMGMRGIDPQHGFTGDYIPETVTDRNIMQIAPTNIIVADHSKLGCVSTVFLAPITAAQILVTDKDASPSIVSELESLGLIVNLA